MSLVHLPPTPALDRDNCLYQTLLTSSGIVQCLGTLTCPSFRFLHSVRALFICNTRAFVTSDKSGCLCDTLCQDQSRMSPNKPNQDPASGSKGQGRPPISSTTTSTTASRPSIFPPFSTLPHRPAITLTRALPPPPHTRTLPQPLAQARPPPPPNQHITTIPLGDTPPVAPVKPIGVWEDGTKVMTGDYILDKKLG